MPRYMVERSFPDGFPIPVDAAGVRACLVIVEYNNLERVSWVQSYISVDRRRSFCICDGPSPEAIRRAAKRSNLPIHRIIEVRVLDPYFYI
jgi:hypothetical protein